MESPDNTKCSHEANNSTNPNAIITYKFICKYTNIYMYMYMSDFIRDGISYSIKKELPNIIEKSDNAEVLWPLMTLYNYVTFLFFLAVLHCSPIVVQLLPTAVSTYYHESSGPHRCDSSKPCWKGFPVSLFKRHFYVCTYILLKSRDIKWGTCEGASSKERRKAASDVSISRHTFGLSSLCILSSGALIDPKEVI